MRNQKLLAEKAIDQLDDTEGLFWLPDEESNSIAILMRHMTNQMKSRWTDFLTTDGEKANRNRPAEFNQDFRSSKEELLEFWNTGWSYLFDALNSLKPEDLLKEVTVRKEKFTAMEAINSQLVHYSNHVGQIVFISKHLAWENWSHLSRPRDDTDF